MTKTLVRDRAEFFAKGYATGVQAGKKRAARSLSNASSRLKYRERRIWILARWRRYAIDRLGLGKEIVSEIDRVSKQRAK